MKNVNYAIYSLTDEYIGGFDKVEQVEQYLGLSKNSLSRIAQNNENTIFREYDEEDKVYYCSQLYHQYLTKSMFHNNKNLGIGIKIYKFWEE